MNKLRINTKNNSLEHAKINNLIKEVEKVKALDKTKIRLKTFKKQLQKELLTSNAMPMPMPMPMPTPIQKTIPPIQAPPISANKQEAQSTIASNDNNFKQFHINTDLAMKNVNATTHNKNSYISKLGLNTVSPDYTEKKPTQINNANLPIIQPDSEITINNMEQLPTEKYYKPSSASRIKTRKEKSTILLEKSRYIKLDDATDYIIVIPSYNRPELIQKKTLALLHRHAIDPARINIFVANQDQYILYYNSLPKSLYGKLIIGVLGLKEQRNYIMNYYPENINIVQMDDDLDKIVELMDKTMSKSKGKSTSKGIKTKRVVRPITDLDGFIRMAFLMCREKSIYLWGVYPLANPKFMSPKITTDLRFIVGPFWGIINRHNPALELTVNEKENSERTLQHYTLDNAVLRFNNIGIETRYYTNKGGMQDEGKNRKVEAFKSALYLHNKYPLLTKIYLKKKSGMPELKLLTKPLFSTKKIKSKAKSKTKGKILGKRIAIGIGKDKGKSKAANTRKSKSKSKSKKL
jgi:hypothetical protein